MSSTIAANEAVSGFTYPVTELKEQLKKIIQQHTAEPAWKWLNEKVSSGNLMQLNTAFAALPRKTGRAVSQLSEEEQKNISTLRPHFTINNWTIDHLSRVWLLLYVDAIDEATYVRSIENLFQGAEMNELVALYSALPVLAYPQQWMRRCAEGIRSNIADVLTAIMCNNPYPSEYLDEPAWNQLVLKAFFTEKPIHQIIGLDRRANKELAYILSDYAHERWAAHRPVNPQLWRCVGPFLDANLFPDMERLSKSENRLEREAASLACWDSQYLPAKKLLESNSDLKSKIETGQLTWQTLAQKASATT